MLETPIISVRQFTILALLYTVGSSIIIIPSVLASQAKQDAWIAGILTLIFGSLIILLFIWIASLYPYLTLVKLCEEILGRWIGKLISLIFISYFMILATTILYDIGSFMTTQIMPETPIEVIHILFILVSLMGVRLGIEVLARAAQIFLPWIILLLLILIVFLTPQLTFHNMQPVLEHGFRPVLGGALPFVSIPFLELIVFLMIVPYLNEREKAGKAFLTGAITGGLILVIISSLTIFVLGADFAAKNNFPTYLLGKKINIGNFIERIEIIVAITWFLTIFFKLSICFFVTAFGIAQTFELSDYRILASPLAMILVVLSLTIVPNTGFFHEFTGKTWPPFSFIFGVFIPLLLLIVAKIRGKPQGEERMKENGGNA